MADKLDVLRDKLFNQADAKLRNAIDEHLEPVLRMVSGRGLSVTVKAGEYPLEKVVALLGDKLHAERREQNRAETVSEFIKKVEEFGQ
jgi:16S rRNA U1498 N3-methylase RsmE